MIYFFHDCGVVQQHSCISTPQQNGVAKRKQLHLLNVVHAVHFHASLPLTTTYLINRVPTPLLSGKTPYEILFQHPPTYGHLRVFGCLCFSTNVFPKGKFSSRANRCVFIGYPYGQKAYRIYDLDSKQIFTSRDVVFHANIFSFANHTAKLPPSKQPVLPLPALDLPSSPTFDPTLPVALSHAPSPTETNDNPSSLFAPRRSLRHRQTLAHLHDYHCPTLPTSSLNPSSNSLHFLTQGTCFPLSNFLSYNHFSSTHRSFVASISTQQEPTSFAQAMQDPHWHEAMDAELATLESNGMWTLVNFPLGHQPIGI